MEKSLHERDRVGVQDSVLLDDYTNEKTFVENLKKRFKENIIYTYIGHVLVSVNPYRQLPIYGKDTIATYQKTHLIENPPHVFAITEAAYSTLVEEHYDQCILISGESGSGKTEASKKVLEYIAAVSDNKGQVQTVKDKLLQSNPVLEAFGNAKTTRNDNSSRFGKYMDIEFNALGNPIGGNILNYLLEKSRVVHQNNGERNFHIFYQLLLGTENDVLSKLHLTRNPEDYNYISHAEHCTENMDDAKQMTEVCKAMKTLGLSIKEQSEIMAIIASVLHLGNIGVLEEKGRAVLNNTSHLKYAAELLGCKEEDLYLSLTQRTILARGDIVSSPLDRETAIYARDALAKAIYDRLFSWLVSRFNKSLQPEHKINNNVMGILDIYGFEIFQKNSFEQFCINYCNEKLQQLFIELTLKSEQEEYLKEGIEWEPVEYFNNNIIINLIEEKHKGIIALLDEECLRPGDTSDITFLEKMSDKLAAHRHFISYQKAETKIKKMMGREEFTLVHYAGDVIYNVHGFLDKNNDLLFRDLREVMSETTNSITKSVFPESELKSKKRPDTAITQFKNSLTQLMNILVSKSPSYIRCIKPNDFKQPGSFNDTLISHQVKYLGLMENLRVRRAGFAYRRNYAEFLKRYKSLCPKTWPSYYGPAKNGVAELVKHLEYKPEEFRMGNTKLFIRHARTLFSTEDAFQVRKNDLACLIQSHWKGYVQRRKYQQMRQAAITIQTWSRRYMAQKEYKRRKLAVQTVRNFIKGFITRSGPTTDLNRKFIQTAKQQYLLRLAKSLPKSLLDKSWPIPPLVCNEASRTIQQLHRSWLARKYRLALTPERKKQLELKVLAEELFKGKKKNYPQSIPVPFADDRLTDAQNLIKKPFFTTEAASGDVILYGCNVIKFDRHGYKRRNRVLFISRKHFYLVMEGDKQFKLKHKIPFETVSKLEVTSERDNFLLIRIPPHLTKDKGDVILEVPHLIEVITKIVSIINNPDILNINTIDDGKICHSLINGKEFAIDLTLGTNGPGISKGKSGQLIVVG
uniref:Putative myosin class ii heavy chain n=1 Tax=Triatoma infestans TaxID=30076 RepID=A0A023FBM3_TRIIF